MADWKTAFIKSIGATVTGYVTSYIKKYIMPKVQGYFGNYQQYAGPAIGFLTGLFLFKFGDGWLGDYTDAIYGALVGAFADPVFYPGAPGSPQQAMARAAATQPLIVASSSTSPSMTSRSPFLS